MVAVVAVTVVVGMTTVGAVEGTEVVVVEAEGTGAVTTVGAINRVGTTPQHQRTQHGMGHRPSTGLLEAHASHR